MGRMPAVLALGTGLGHLQLVLQEGVPRALLARRWHAMLGLRPSSSIASAGLAGEWKSGQRRWVGVAPREKGWDAGRGARIAAGHAVRGRGKLTATKVW